MGRRFNDAKRNLRNVIDDHDISSKKPKAWDVAKWCACLVGSAAANYVVGTIARNNLPQTDKKFDMVRGWVGVYLIEGMAAAAVGNYIHSSLSSWDFLFEDAKTEEVENDAE